MVLSTKDKRMPPFLFWLVYFVVSCSLLAYFGGALVGFLYAAAFLGIAAWGVALGNIPWPPRLMR